MTRLQRKGSGNGHSYKLDGTPVPGVTTIAGKLDKSGPLKIWAARQSASYAVEHWAELTDKPIMERARAIEDAHKHAVTAKATRGTRIHALADRVSRGESVEVPAELRGPVEAYRDFLDRWEIETIATESPVAHTGHQYAGTLDAIVRAPKLGTVLLDIKTANRVYSEVSLQLAGYRFCDLRQFSVETVGPRGGKRTEVHETDMVPVDGCYVAHVLPDDVALIPVETDEQIWATFLYLREVYEFAHRVDWRGENRPTVGEPVYPEQLSAPAVVADAVPAAF